MSAPLAPMVHLNGTGRAELEKQLEGAARALWDAVNAVQDTYPNGRDYYPLGDGAYRQALAEHKARVDALVRVHGEIMEILSAVRG